MSLRKIHIMQIYTSLKSFLLYDRPGTQICQIPTKIEKNRKSQILRKEHNEAIKHF